MRGLIWDSEPVVSVELFSLFFAQVLELSVAFGLEGLVDSVEEGLHALVDELLGGERCQLRSGGLFFLVLDLHRAGVGARRGRARRLTGIVAVLILPEGCSVEATRPDAVSLRRLRVVCLDSLAGERSVGLRGPPPLFALLVEGSEMLVGLVLLVP